MPWSGGIFTRLYNWYQEYLDGFDIDPQKFDGEDDNFTTGINNCLTKDGQNAPDQDLPMATKKHTNVGNADSRDQYLPVGQYQDGWAVYGVEQPATTADIYVVTLTPPIANYVEGMRLWWMALTTCNAGASLNVNGKGNRNLEVGGVAVLAGDIQAGQIYGLFYTGSSWQIHASGANNFLALSDTPDDYTGRDGQSIIVNATEDALIFSGAGVNTAGKMSNTGYSPAGTGVLVIFDTENFDLQSNIVDLAGNLFDIPEDGLYQVIFSANVTPGLNPATNNDWAAVELEVNTVLVDKAQVSFYHDEDYPSTYQWGLRISTLLELSLGDEVTFTYRGNLTNSPQLTLVHADINVVF